MDELKKALGETPTSYQAEKRSKAYKWKYIMARRIACGLLGLASLLAFLLIQAMRVIK